MLAPAIAPDGEKKMRTNLPCRSDSHQWMVSRTTFKEAERVLTNLDELLLRIVWAFPKASRIGLASRIWRSSIPRFASPRFRLELERRRERVESIVRGRVAEWRLRSRVGGIRWRWRRDTE